MVCLPCLLSGLLAPPNPKKLISHYKMQLGAKLANKPFNAVRRSTHVAHNFFATQQLVELCVSVPPLFSQFYGPDR